MPQLVPACKHITWRTIHTGESKALDVISIFALRIQMTAEALTMVNYLSHMSLGEVKTVRLVLKTVAELNFKSGAALRKVDWARKEQGLIPCPMDTALALRSTFASLPLNEEIRFMSDPIYVGGRPLFFSARRSSTGIILAGLEIAQGDNLNPDDRLIFAKVDGRH